MLILKPSQRVEDGTGFKPLGISYLSKFQQLRWGPSRLREATVSLAWRSPLALCCHPSCVFLLLSQVCLLPSPSPLFPGTWAHSFNLESTREDNFYVNETTTVKVSMMFQSSTIKYLNDSVLPCQLVQLDYTGNETVFFVLPVKGKMDTVIAMLSRDTIQRWSKSLTNR